MLHTPINYESLKKEQQLLMTGKRFPSTLERLWRVSKALDYLDKHNDILTSVLNGYNFIITDLFDNFNKSYFKSYTDEVVICSSLAFDPNKDFFKQERKDYIMIELDGCSLEDICEFMKILGYHTSFKLYCGFNAIILHYKDYSGREVLDATDSLYGY